MIPGLRDLTHSERLRRLNLWTLEERRNRADLIELFKIHRHESAVEITDMFQPAAETRTRGHTLKLQKNRCRLDLRKYFFSERVVDRWNALDQKTVESGTLNMFKNRLNVIRMDKMGFFTAAKRPLSLRPQPAFPGAAHQVIGLYQVISYTSLHFLVFPPHSFM